MNIGNYARYADPSRGTAFARLVVSSRLRRTLLAGVLLMLLANASTGVSFASFNDLIISVQEYPTNLNTVSIGEEVTYVVRVNNSSSTEAVNNVRVRIQLSPNVDYKAGSEAPAFNAPFEWQLPTVAPNTIYFHYVSATVKNTLDSGAIITTTVTIDDGTSNPPKTAEDTTTVQAPKLEITPSPLDFGNQRINTTSATRFLTVRNTGDLSVNLNSAILAPAHYFDFDTSATTCVTTAQTLNPNDSCVIGIRFIPGEIGNHSATVTIHDNRSLSHTVTIQGSGTDSQADLSVTSLDFGTQIVGTISATKSVTLTNSGTGPLTLSSITVSGAFAQTNNCGTSLASGASCIINATFTPTATGTLTGTLTITDNAPGSPHTVSLTGVGIQPVVAVDLTSLDFGDQNVGSTSQVQSLVLHNNGDAPLAISSIEISGDFTQTTDCPSSLPAGASCTITVTFSPSTSGSHTGMLTINHNGPNTPTTITLSGNGLTVMMYKAYLPNINGTNKEACLPYPVLGKLCTAQ